MVSRETRQAREWWGNFTKGIAVADFGPPAAYQMDLVLRNGCHLGVPISNQFGIFVNAILLHLVENNRMDVLATSQDLREAALDVLVELATLGCTVDERRQRTTLLFGALLLPGAGLFCKGSC